MFVAPARVATTGQISLVGEQTIDGAPVVDGDSVLVKNQIDAVENGVYVAAIDAWSRAPDFGPGVIDQGTSIIVLGGATQANTIWVLATANPILVGTTALEFQAVPDLSAFVTQTGVETLTNKTFSGTTNFYTDGDRIGITSADAPLGIAEALVHIVNDNSVGCGFRTASYWIGTTEAPYQNNDNSLWEVHNDAQSDSLNRSWAGSFANAYNGIPAGVTDTGERTGVIGWAVSAAKVGYEHAGTLARQIGVHGTAGFQGPGSAAGAVIVNATGVRGFIYNDSVGATIQYARAGEFITTAVTGSVGDNIAVYASAANGTIANWAYYGADGRLYNAGQALFGAVETQSSSKVAARGVGNAYEFGHPDPGGYGSNIGVTQPSGYPFVAFCAEAELSGNTFRTRGKPGVVIQSDVAGALIFARLTDANASGQSLTESARFDASGNLSVVGNLSAASGAVSGAFSAGSLTLGADLPITEGGTGASTASAARTNLGLGSAATKDVGTSGDAVPVLNGAATTWAAGMTICGNVNASGQVATGGASSQSSSSVVARKNGNGVEFGHPDVAGYASNLGATAQFGYPFLAFCAEAEASGNTFRTRGKLGTVVWSDLSGSLVFSRAINANASGQNLSESARFDANGHLVFAETPVLKQYTPASASAAGQAGEICWDANYLYVCVGTNTWKRAALATW